MSPQDPERGPRNNALGKPGCNGGRVLGRGRGRRSDPKDFICFCQGISRQEIVNCIDEGAQTLEDIQNGIGATVGPCGGSCTPNVVKLLNETLARKAGKPAAAQSGPTNPASKPAPEETAVARK